MLPRYRRCPDIEDSGDEWEPAPPTPAASAVADWVLVPCPCCGGAGTADVPDDKGWREVGGPVCRATGEVEVEPAGEEAWAVALAECPAGAPS